MQGSEVYSDAQRGHGTAGLNYSANMLSAQSGRECKRCVVLQTQTGHFHFIQTSGALYKVN